jgi:hypothetical protein
MRTSKNIINRSDNNNNSNNSSNSNNETSRSNESQHSEERSLPLKRHFNEDEFTSKKPKVVEKEGSNLVSISDLADGESFLAMARTQNGSRQVRNAYKQFMKLSRKFSTRWSVR